MSIFGATGTPVFSKTESEQPHSHLAGADKDLSMFPEIHLWPHTYQSHDSQHCGGPTSSQHVWAWLMIS